MYYLRPPSLSAFPFSFKTFIIVGRMKNGVYCCGPGSDGSPDKRVIVAIFMVFSLRGCGNLLRLGVGLAEEVIYSLLPHLHKSLRREYDGNGAGKSLAATQIKTFLKLIINTQLCVSKRTYKYSNLFSLV